MRVKQRAQPLLRASRRGTCQPAAERAVDLLGAVFMACSDASSARRGAPSFSLPTGKEGRGRVPGDVLHLPEREETLLHFMCLRMFRAGCAEPDLSWLVEHGLTCPTCGGPSEGGSLSAMMYPAPEGMRFLPFAQCSRCKQAADAEEKVSEALAQASAPTTVHTHHFLLRVPREHVLPLWEIVEAAVANDDPCSLAWVVSHPQECAACGRRIKLRGSRSILRTASMLLQDGSGVVVKMPFLLCSGCALRDSAAVTQAAPRLAEAFVRDAEQRRWVLPHVDRLKELGKIPDLGHEADSADSEDSSSPQSCRPQLRLLRGGLHPEPPDDA